MKAKLATLLRNLLILAAICGAAFLAYRVLKLHIASRQFKQADDSFVAYNMHIRVWNEDKVRWEIWARKVVISKTRNIYNITDIRKGVYYAGKKTYTFSSPGGWFDADNKLVRVNGRTVFRATKGGDYFAARSMFWDGRAERLEMTGGVQVSQEGNIFKGDSLVSMGEKIRNYTVTGNVRVFIPDTGKSDSMSKEIKDSGLERREVRRIVLRAQKVEYNGGNKTLRCYAELPAMPGAPGAAAPQAPGAAQLPPGAAQLPPAAAQFPPLPGMPMQPAAPSPQLNMPQNMPLPLPQGNVGMIPGVTPDSLLAPPMPPAAQQSLAWQQPKSLVYLATGGYTIEAYMIYVDYKTGKFARATGFVKIERGRRRPDKKRRKVIQALQKRTATLFTNDAEYFWGEGRISIYGALSVRQENLAMSAGSGVLYTKLDKAELRGGVTLYQKPSDWLLKEKIVEDDASDETKEASKEETTVMCSAMDIDLEKEDITATGNVSLTQKKRNLTADSATYEGETGVWRVYGSVRARNKEDFFSAGIIEYNETTREIFALTDASILALPRPDEQDELEDYFRDRDDQPLDSKTFRKEKVSVTADRLHYDERKDILRADGNAVLKFRDIEMRGTKIVVNYEDKKATGEGGVIIKDKYTTITGDHSDADWKSHDFTVKGDTVRLSYTGREASEKRDKTDPFDIVCKKLDYNSESRDGKAEGAPVITSPGRRASGGLLTFNIRDEVYVLDRDVKIHQDNGDWLRDKDYIDADDRQAWSVAEKPTDITCAHAVFNNGSDRFTLTGGVKISQKEKDVSADSVEFFGRDRRLVLDGDVFMEQASGEWLFEGGFIEEDEDEDIKKRARDHVEITAAKVESQYGERKLYMTGGVVVRQGRSEARGETVWYYGKDKLTVIEGDVSFQDEDGRDLTARRIVYNGKTKEMEAFSAVRGSGLAEKKKKKAAQR